MRTSPLVALGITLAVLACGSTEDRVAARGGAVARAFDASALAAGVPRDLLVAIAQTEGGLDMPRTRLHLEIDAAVPVAGPLQLRHGSFDSLARGAAILGTSELVLRQDSDLALEAGARVLAELGAKSGARADETGTWGDALETMSGYADVAHQKAYAHRVFALLARGGTFVARDGEPVTIAPHDLPPTLTLDLDTSLRIESGADYAPAEFIVTSCTNKCTPGRGGNSVEYIVIHDTEGGWDASVATLQNDPNKSVQYLVGTDGRVAQFIHEVDTAWHAGNFYYNQRSVGIEHVGYKVGPFPDAEYDASAKLVTYLAAKYGVVKDRAHIIGHDQVPDGTVIAESDPPCSTSPAACEGTTKYGGASNHTDPGVWEWCPYMARFGGACKCNDVTAIFNCAYDKATAVRCVGGNVELLTCDGVGGCETMPNGTDDVCHQAPVPEAAPPPPVAQEPDSGAPPPPAASPTSLPPSSSPTAAESSGCSAVRRGETGTSGRLWPLLGIALLAVARRRRSR